MDSLELDGLLERWDVTSSSLQRALVGRLVELLYEERRRREAFLSRLRTALVEARDPDSLADRVEGAQLVASTFYGPDWGKS